MNIDSFRERVRETFSNNPSQFLETIPAGSGICHIANVGPDQWNPGFVSTAPGRWNENGERSKYFAQDFSVCAAELGYTQDCPPSGKIFEVYETARDFSAFNIARLPSDIRQAIYEDLGAAPGKWDKSHALRDEMKRIREFDDVGCIYAPSASGQMLDIGGMCLVANPEGPDVRRVGKYNYEEAVKLNFL